MRSRFPTLRHRAGHLLARRDLLGASVTTLVALAALSVPSRAADSAGRVEEIKGEAFADAGSQRRPLATSSLLYVGDRVATGASSRLAMLLGEDTTIRLGEQAHLVIDRFLAESGGDISLGSGPMLFDRPRGARSAAMQIKSSYGLIAVRGTKFFAGPSEGVFGVFVDHGTVLVSAGGGEVLLNAGEGTNVHSPGDKPSAAIVWGKERIQHAFASVE